MTRIGALLRPADFYRESHGQIFQAILELHERNQPSDFITVSDELTRIGRLEEAGGASYLTYLITPSRPRFTPSITPAS